MRPSEEKVAEVTSAFQAAAVDGVSWMSAIEQLAAATGSKSGQLIGFAPGGAVPFNWVTECSPDLLREFIEVNGGDPRVNPRVRAGLAAPELKVLAEADFADPSAPPPPEYQAYVRRHDIPYICLTNIIRQDDLVVGLSVLRSGREGHIEDAERRAFAAIAPHVRAAVKTGIALQGQGAQLIAGAMEALSIIAFVCDGAGLVRAMTPGAEEIVRRQQGLRLRHGRLAAGTEADTRALNLALASLNAGMGVPRASTTLVLNGAEGAEPLLVEVAPLPQVEHGFVFRATTLVIVRGPRTQNRRAAQVAQALFGLTQAEAAVTADLVEGLTPQTIAERAGVSVSTVRTHIRHVFDKAGVTSQIELVGRITARF